MAQLDGFGFFEKRAVRQAITDSDRALDKALKEAFDNNDAFLKRMDDYFGAGSGGAESTSHQVMKTINSMKLAIRLDVFRVQRGGAPPTTNAEAENLPQTDVQFKGTAQKKARTARWQGMTVYRGKDVSVLEATILDASLNGSFTITLYDLYFAMRFKERHSQSQVETFLHELSHTAAGTHDVNAPKCYGYNGAMYCKSIGKGALNAENYGMFLQSYLI